jgi:type IV secretory pathway TrbL component
VRSLFALWSGSAETRSTAIGASATVSAMTDPTARQAMADLYAGEG